MDQDLPMSDAFYEELARIVEANMEKEQFGANELVQEVGLSRSQVHRKLKSITGQSISQFIREIRLRRAHELLEDQIGTASEIAYKVGFNSPTYFNKCFHDHFGYPPGSVKRLDIFALVDEELVTPTREELRGRAKKTEKSIAVIPFRNMSSDPEQDFLSEGISEEIINALAQIKGLKVVGRTSSFSFKNKEKDLRYIGKQLNVTNLLEGSVRKEGNRIRVTSQLVNVSDGFQQWSERYDRELKDIFAIQDEIASAIASKMEMTLLADSRNTRNHGSATTVEAYENYLKGRRALYQRGLSILDAKEYFERAISIDPKYPLAHAALAETYTSMSYYGLARPKDCFSRAKTAVKQAMELDNLLPEAHHANAIISTLYDWNWSMAERSFIRALDLNPGYIQVLCTYGLLFPLLKGDFERGLGFVYRAVEIDPLSAYSRAMYAFTLFLAGRYEEALDQAQRSVEFDAHSMLGLWILHLCLYNNANDYAKSISVGEEALAISNRDPWALQYMAVAYAEGGEPEKAQEIMQELITRSEQVYTPSTHLAVVAAALGEAEKAETFLLRAYRDRDSNLPMITNYRPDISALKRLPVFQEVRKKLSLGDQNESLASSQCPPSTFSS